MAKKKAKATVCDYRATLVIYGKRFEGIGDSIQGAIAAIEPGNVRGKGVLIVEHGEQKQERVFPPTILFRVFGPARGISREIALKQAAQRFAV